MDEEQRTPETAKRRTRLICAAMTKINNFNLRVRSRAPRTAFTLSFTTNCPCPLYSLYFISIYPMTSTQDRTNEFKACVDSIRNRSALGNRNSESKQRLLQNNTKSPGKGEFSHMASSIGKDISSTTLKLNKLAQCGSVLIWHLIP